MSRFQQSMHDRAASPMVSRRRLLAIAGVSAPAVLIAPALAGRVLAQADTGTPAAATGSTGGIVTTDSGVFFDPSVVHEVSATIDQDAYDAMIDTYSTSGEKDWVEATVTINGQTFKQAGLRLKGNSSLMGLRQDGMGAVGGRGGMPQGAAQTQATEATPDATGGQDATATPGASATQGQMPAGGGGMGGGMANISADKPEGLPWLVKLDEFVKDQEYQGLSQFVIRSNNSKTSLNEAVALDLLMEAGLASQMAAYASFSVNGSDPALRLMIENPKTKWMKAHFSGDGLLFKSEAEGDWSYRGDDPASYTDVFDLEAGDWGSDEKNFAPLTSFLDFINTSDDETFASDLPDRLDVGQFAIYLAMMSLIQNSDDIDGPGNNSYLYVAPKSEQMTVVPWDMNLAFGGMGGGFGGAGMGQGNIPRATDANGTPAAQSGGNGMQGRPGGGQGNGMQGGFGGKTNPLVEHFNANTDFAAMVTDQQTSLQASLFKGGVGADILARWVAVLEADAATLVDADTITSEADSIASFFTASS
ncbi:MAG: CotH kinase family protein [Thermomicrobiales bacterium]